MIKSKDFKGKCSALDIFREKLAQVAVLREMTSRVLRESAKVVTSREE